MFFVGDTQIRNIGYYCPEKIKKHKKKNKGGQWIRGKSFDTYSPMGPTILLQERNVNPNNLNLWTFVNEKKVQNSNTNDLIFNVQKIVSFLSIGTTLLPGTAILTGTPQGIGLARKPPLMLQNRDEVVVAVENIGELCNSVTWQQKSQL